MTRSRDQLLRINGHKIYSYIILQRFMDFLLFSVFGKMLVISYRMAGKFDGLTFFALTIKLISVNVNFPYAMPSYRAFRQIKIHHIFIMQFGGYFVKFSGHTVFPHDFISFPLIW